MPAGCDFYCNHDSCKAYKTGFTITAPWPMTRIEKVISKLNAENKKEFREKLISLKNEGKKYSCIMLPNNNCLEIEKYRVQAWSEEANCIWEFVVDSIDDIDNIPGRCTKTQCKLKKFEEVVKEGILCPHCGSVLEQERWYAKE